MPCPSSFWPVVLLAACRADPTNREPEPTDAEPRHSSAPGPTADTGPAGPTADTGDTEPGHTGHTGDHLPPPGSWSAGTTLPLALQETAVVALGGEVVLLGGLIAGGARSDLALAFDPATATWRRLPDLPDRLHHANAAVVGGVVYLLGFLVADFDHDGSVYALDPAVGAWEPRAPMPAGTERGGGATVVLDGRIHVVGGLHARRAVTDHAAYDPSTDTWTVLAPMPTPRDHLAAGVVDGRLYAVGGRDVDADLPMDLLEIYDPTTGGWTTGAPLPTARGGLAAAVLDGRLYTFGGEGNALDPSGVFPQTEVYLPARDAWYPLAPMATPRHGTGAAVVDGRIWVPGGADRQSLAPTTANEAFSP